MGIKSEEEERLRMQIRSTLYWCKCAFVINVVICTVLSYYSVFYGNVGESLCIAWKVNADGIDFISFRLMLFTRDLSGLGT